MGRTAKGLTALFDELSEWKVNLISPRDGIDLSVCRRRGHAITIMTTQVPLDAASFAF